MSTAPNVTIIPAKIQTAENRDKYHQLKVAAYCRVSTEQEEQQNSMDGYTVTNDKEDKFAGKDAYIVDVTGEIGSQKVLLNQIITSDNGNLVVITYGASEAAYSKLSDEFKTVLDSFELK